MKKILISCLLTAVIVTAALVIEAGYFIGSNFAGAEHP